LRSFRLLRRRHRQRYSFTQRVHGECAPQTTRAFAATDFKDGHGKTVALPHPFPLHPDPQPMWRGAISENNDITMVTAKRSAKEIADAAGAWGQNYDTTVVTLRRAG